MNSDNLLNIIISAVDNASKTLTGVAGSLTALDASTLASNQSAANWNTTLADTSPELAAVAVNTGLLATKSDALRATLDTVSTSAGKLASAFMPISVGAAVILGVAAKAATDFDQQMELLHTQAGLSQTSVDQLKNSVLALAPTVGQSPEALATAFYHVASAGNGLWSTAQMLDTLKIAAEGAAVGQSSLDDTTYALTSSLASNIKGASGAAQMMAVLNAIVGAGDMHMQDLNGAIGTGFLSTAASFGISIQSVGTALATLTDNGEGADAAATRLRMTWALMGSPSAAAAKQLSLLGLTTDQVSTATGTMNDIFAKSGLTTTKLADDLRQPNGMTVALTDLQTHLENAGLSASQTDAMLAKAFGGGRTDAALLTMLQNLDRMNAKFQIINGTTNQFGEDWAAQQDQASQKLKDLEASFEVLAVKLGNEFLPTLLAVVGGVTKFADSLGRLPAGQLKIISDILVGLVILAPIVKVVSLIAESLGALLGVLDTVGTAFITIGAVIAGALALPLEVGIVIAAGVAALATLVIMNWQKISTFFVNMWNDLMSFARSGVGEIVLATTPLIGLPVLIIAHWQQITGFFTSTWSKLSSDLGSFSSTFVSNWNLLTKKVEAGWTGLWANPGAQIRTWAQQLTPIVSSGLSGVAKSMEDYDKTSLKNWGNYWNSVITGAVSWNASLNVKALQGGKDYHTAVVNGLKDLPKAFEDAWNSVASTTVQFFKDLPNALKSDVGKSGQDIAKNHTDGFAAIWKDKSTVDKIGDAIIEGLALILASVLIYIVDLNVKVYQTVWKAIQIAFTDAGSMLFDIGKLIVQGLISGIESMLGAANSAIKNLGNGIVSNVKTLLGIKSPSTVFAEIGSNIGQGLANGIIGTQAAVKNAVSNLVQAGTGAAIGVGITASGGVSNAVTATSSGTTINQTNHIYNQVDMDKANRDLAWRMAHV